MQYNYIPGSNIPQKGVVVTLKALLLNGVWIGLLVTGPKFIG